MPLYKETLERYPAAVFFETGTYDGEACQLALSLGFRVIHSIELDEGRFEGNVRRFADKPEVKLYQGYSEELLAALLPTLDRNETVTFWLDAHPPGELTLLNCPVKDELTLIELEISRGLKVHAIMIDDMRLFSKKDQAWLKKRLATILPKGQVVLDKGIEDQDVLTVYSPLQ